MILKRREFLAKASIDDQTLDVWLSEEWLIPSEAAQGEAFTEADVARAHLIHDLEEDLGVNSAGISVALHLLDQLHGLRNAVKTRH
ncbi:chaperone modulator CbpM [Aestuariivirga litoralis]|uniref:chaperone modulator CbpM n=1 Tax=Aestuariivirga litoralis TaxID=2650924 RepID=UPI0018C5D11A|nr:chaperone modulator CbpM [Aestuariivirga litoralis]MBG1231687.1 hypothetical protein [Aestuariivirga litoralis]